MAFAEQGSAVIKDMPATHRAKKGVNVLLDTFIYFFPSEFNTLALTIILKCMF